MSRSQPRAEGAREWTSVHAWRGHFGGRGGTVRKDIRKDTVARIPTAPPALAPADRPPGRSEDFGPGRSVWRRCQSGPSPAIQLDWTGRSHEPQRTTQVVGCGSPLWVRSFGSSPGGFDGTSIRTRREWRVDMRCPSFGMGSKRRRRAAGSCSTAPSGGVYADPGDARTPVSALRGRALGSRSRLFGVVGARMPGTEHLRVKRTGTEEPSGTSGARQNPSGFDEAWQPTSFGTTVAEQPIPLDDLREEARSRRTGSGAIFGLPAHRDGGGRPSGRTRHRLPEPDKPRTLAFTAALGRRDTDTAWNRG